MSGLVFVYILHLISPYKKHPIENKRSLWHGRDRDRPSGINLTTPNPIKLYSQLIKSPNKLRITTMIYLSYFTIYFAGAIVMLLNLKLLNIGWVLLEEGQTTAGAR